MSNSNHQRTSKSHRLLPPLSGNSAPLQGHMQTTPLPVQGATAGGPHSPTAGGGGQTAAGPHSPSTGGGGQLVKGSTKAARLKMLGRNKIMASGDMVITGHNVGINGPAPIISHVGEERHTTDLNEDSVSSFINSNQHFLDSYVSSHVNQDRVEKWLRLKTMRLPDVSRFLHHHQASTLVHSSSGESSRNNQNKDSIKAESSALDVTKRKLLQDISNDISVAESTGQVLSQLAARVAAATDADGFNVYTINPNTQEIQLYTETQEETGKKVWKIETVSYLSNFIARSKQTVRTNTQQKDARFPQGIVRNTNKAHHVLASPMLNYAEQVIGVVELYRKPGGHPFTDNDEQVSLNLLLLSDLLLKCHELYENMIKQRNLNDFLLVVTKSIFQDIVSIDAVILKIMNYAKTLVNADRTAMFLVDRHTNEIYSHVFDVGNEAYGSSGASKNEIRFSTNKGVAGYVAATGQTVNIPDAYLDERFNRDIDNQTGYKTKSILCMPICIRGKIIGVVQMVNKLDGTFTSNDEESFEMFAVYCGLALHQAKLYEKIRRSEQKNKVALEVLSYHSQASDEELGKIQNSKIPTSIPELLDFNFSPWSVSNDDKPLYVLHMFQDMFSPTRYEMDCLSRFTLTVRKNYRNVPYHNWSHAFSVAQSLFTITKNCSFTLTNLERLAMFVACLCHDVDHRGFTNTFMVTSSSPIASLYSTSTMEHHHFNQTITILQHEGHNVFNYLSSEEYKQVLGDIKHFILATDLAIFFQNRSRIKEHLAEGSFDWSRKEHRQLGFSIWMTACDLCASSKPWDVQMETVAVIFEEFYAQGDKEKAQNKTPIAMMDRDKSDELASSQVGFLVGICVPCYDLLAQIIPETQPMLEGSKLNLKAWQEKADSAKKKNTP